MNATRSGLAGVTVTLLLLSANSVQGQEKWTTITDPGAVRKLISDRVVDGKYWMFYFRRDGNMAYYYVSSKAMTIRKWSIRKDGQVCTAVFVKPDHVIGCFTFYRTPGNAPKYRLRTRGIGASAFTLRDKPAALFVKAVEAKAGPVKSRRRRGRSSRGEGGAGHIALSSADMHCVGCMTDNVNG